MLVASAAVVSFSGDAGKCGPRHVPEVRHHLHRMIRANLVSCFLRSVDNTLPDWQRLEEHRDPCEGLMLAAYADNPACCETRAVLLSVQSRISMCRQVHCQLPSA